MNNWGHRMDRREIETPVWAYDQAVNDFRLFRNAQEWEDHIDISGAVSYLVEHLQKSLKDDFYPAYEVYRARGVGFFALPRIVFPYVTFLGTLFVGKDHSMSAVRYMNRYLSRVNHSYWDRTLCEFIYDVYRHGLVHTNMPKVVFEDGKVYGWQITFDDRRHLSVDKSPAINGKSALLTISPKKLADEVISSVDEYVKDLESGLVSLDRFKRGFLLMSATSHYTTPVAVGRHRRLPICLLE